MPSLNFTVFLDKVVDGTKPHSIRAGERFKVGDDLSFFTGMRTKKCRRLRPNTPCTAAVSIRIPKRGRIVLGDGSRFYRPGTLEIETVAAIAYRDGFDSLGAFFDFFRGQIPKGKRVFRGQLVEWIP